MTEIATIFAPAVAAHLLYSVLFLVGIAVALAAVEKVRQIRARYGYIKFAPRYAVAYLSARAARSSR